MENNDILQNIIDVQKQILEEVENLNYGSPDKDMSSSEKLTDRLVKVLGSWKFVLIQSIILTAWIITNILMLRDGCWDPYPFILLNLVLSFQAAYATPFILMASNRQEQKDRRRAVDAYRSIENIEAMQKRLHKHLKIVNNSKEEDKNGSKE